MFTIPGKTLPPPQYSSSPHPGMGREFTILTHAENTNRATDSRTAVTLFPKGVDKMGGARLHNRETRTTLKKEGKGGPPE